MVDSEGRPSASTATETHREPHGAASPHGAADDVPEHGDADAHGGVSGQHDEDALGPIDVQAWAAGALGIALGLIVAVCLVVATRIV